MKTRKHRQSQTAGTLYIKRTLDDKIQNSIYQILKHASEIEVFGANSLQGLNLKITIPADKSRLIGSSINNLGTPIRQFIIKLVISYQTSRSDIYWNTSSTGTYIPKQCAKESEFIKEINLQQDIFVKSSYLGNPLCPAIITGGIYKNTNTTPPDQSFTKLHQELVKMSRRLNNLDFLNILDKMNTAITNNRFYLVYNSTDVPPLRYISGISGIGIGLICMELLDGYQPLYQELRTSDLNKQLILYAQGVYNLARLISIGYFHGDLHSNNMMYNSTTQKMMIIDFGRTVRIQDENRVPVYNVTQNFFLNLFNNYNFIGFTNERDKIAVLKGICKDIMNYYKYRQTDRNYSLHNNVKQENIFFNTSRLDPHIHTIQTRFAEYFIQREIQVRQLVDNGDLNHLVHMKSLKNDVLDVFGRLHGLKLKRPERYNIEMDFELLMFLRRYTSRSNVVQSASAMRKINNAALPRIYKQQLESIMARARAKQTRRLRRRR
jgi:hypothetical protein